jgi:2-keto-3-deoxy-L-rhamnonate aldolase RhmA
MPAPVRQALLRRELSIGTWLQAGHPAVAEILGAAGYDWVAADCEHTDIGPAEFAGVARALAASGTPCLARVRQNDTLDIRQALDLGACGVIVPLVNSPDEARRAVAAARFPPAGVRGFSFCRANDWGATFAEYAAAANDEVAVVVMAESREAVEAIDAILAVPGVDGVFVGPYDMSGSYGIPGQTDAPEIRDALRRIGAACARAGKAAGMHIVQPAADVVQTARDAGFTFLAVGMDTVFLADGARAALDIARRRPVE